MSASSSRRRASPLRAQLREAVARAILDAAEAVIAERGLPEASLAAIAERAGVAVGTLYNYHRDRDDLVRALFEARAAEIAPLIEATTAAARGLPFEQRLRRYFHDVLAIFDRHRRFMRVVMEAEHLKAPLPRGKKKPLLTAIVGGLTELVEAGVAERVLPAGRDELLVRLLLGNLRSVNLLATEQDRPCADDADLVADLFLHGAARRPAP